MITVEELAELLGPEPTPFAVAWAHQAKEFDEHKDDRFRVLLWSMRTGKSKAVIDKAEYQFSEGAIEGVILLAPNGIHLNWVINEIPKWSWPENGQHMAFGWEAPKRADWAQIAKLKALIEHTGGLKWLAINMEAFGGGTDNEATRAILATVRAFRKSCHGKFMLVISEAHHFGQAGAKRTNRARALGRLAKFVTLETGTAILNSPLRAYSMYKIGDDLALGPEYADNSYEKFVQRHAVLEEVTKDKEGSSFFRRNRKYRRVKGYKNTDELRTKIAPWSSVVLRKDIEDMPELLRTDRLIVMSEKQRRAYLEMVSRHLVETEGLPTVSAPDAGARMMKLQQIVNGYLKLEDEIIDIDEDAPIYEAMVEEVYGTLPGKTIIWCRYHEDIRRVVKKLRTRGFWPLEFHGRIPTDKREGIRVAFNKKGKYNPLVGQPAAGGEGRDFSGADTVLFFSSTPNAIHVTQAEERATLIAGHSVSIVRMRTRGTVDDRNWDIVDGKITLADTISGTGLRDLLRETNV
jgi:hypothetical protein